MPFLFQYLIKFSLSLAVLYTFYYVVLRPLTFYQWNRFYLLCYLLLSFIIPFINITNWIPAENMNAGSFINSIPVVEKITFHPSSHGAYNILQSTTILDLAWVVFLMGASIMLIRVVYQYLSLRAMKHRAVLLKTGDFEFYDVNAAINPFSFANAIFINSRLHTEEEFHRILEHEFVHVKQKHTIDIVLAELVCILNWFNPFAWLIRKAIRQNLEFIADHNVLEGGIDPRQYQYLLLKVMCLPQFKIANNFSFSSLKKRIIMMNKIKSARVHLVKFLFIVPLLAVMLLAFRDKINFQKDDLMFTYAGIVMKANNFEPLNNIVIKELYSNTEIKSDERGFFKLQLPVKNDTTNLKLQFFKNGFLKRELFIGWTKFKPKMSESIMGFVGIDDSDSESKSCEKCFANNQQVLDKDHLFVKDLSYEIIQGKFSEFIQSRKDVDMLMAALSKSSSPIVRIRKQLYVMSGNPPGINPESKENYFLVCTDSPDPDIYLNENKTTIENVNATVNRIEIKDIAFLNEERALKKYGKASNAISIITYSGIGTDTIPRKRIAPIAPIKELAEPIDSIQPPPPPPPPIPPVPSVSPVKPKKVKVSVAPVPAVTEQVTPVAPVSPGINIKPVSVKTKISQTVVADEPLYVVDGKIVEKGKALQDVNPDSIKSINVIKGSDAIALYGEKAINGVIQVSTGDLNSSEGVVSASASKIVINNIQDIKALIMVDGVETSKEKLSAMGPGSLKTISVLKGAMATDLYKEKGKDGVIIITTK